MGYPFPKAPEKVGEVPAPETVPVLRGSSPTDLQRIVGAQYVASGLLPSGGGAVSGTSSMAYAVTAGACFMWVSSQSRLGMLVPFEAATVVTDPAPATGSRTDTVYVDGSGVVRVAAGSDVAPSGVAIARFTVPAGITATTAAQQSMDRSFAVATGASTGRLARWEHPGGNIPTGEHSHFRRRFVASSDLNLRIDVAATVAGIGGGAGAGLIEVNLDDGRWTRWVNFTYGASWETKTASLSTSVFEGPHTVEVKTRNLSGAGFRFGPSPQLAEMNLWDGGVTR